MFFERVKKIGKQGCEYLNTFGQKHGYAVFFVIPIVISLLVHLLNVIIQNDPSLAVEMYFLNGRDLFMDFFNSVRDAAQGAAVYTERLVIYPPMANLICLLFSRFMPAAYTDTPFSLRETWVEYPGATLSVFVFLGIPALLLALLCYKNLKAGETVRAAMSFAVLINAPMLFMLERGNILLYALVALLIFACYYNSENKVHREIALIALAFSFSIKLYPVIFGWLLVADKRYRDAIRCAVYGILMLLLPSFFFGGPQCIWWMVKNVLSFSADRSSTVNWTSQMFDNVTFGNHLATAVLVIAILLFIIAPFFQKKNWRVMVIGVSALFAFPALNSSYTWAFFLVPLLLLLNQKPEGLDWLYFVLISLPMLFYPAFNAFNYIRLGGILLMAIVLLCGVDTALAIYRYIRERRQSRVDGNTVDTTADA